MNLCKRFLTVFINCLIDIIETVCTQSPCLQWGHKTPAMNKRRFEIKFQYMACKALLAVPEQRENSHSHFWSVLKPLCAQGDLLYKNQSRSPMLWISRFAFMLVWFLQVEWVSNLQYFWCRVKKSAHGLCNKESTFVWKQSIWLWCFGEYKPYK